MYVYVSSIWMWPGTEWEALLMALNSGLSLRVKEEPLTGPTDHWQPATIH